MIDPLPLDRLHDLVASYGANPERWPADQLSGAVACLIESEAGRAAWRDAAALDADLDNVAGQETSPELMEKVMAIGGTSEEPNAGMSAGVLRYVVPYAAAAAIALVVGLAVPSPFRVGTGTSQLADIAVSEPSNSTGIDDGLTALALVDVGIFDDDENDSDNAFNTGSLLADLPLL